MPELPEVETVRMGLEPALVGRSIVRVVLNRADLRFPFPERFVKRLTGARVSSLARRAKYLVAHLSTGEALVMHLGMTGRFHVQARGDNRPHLLGDYEYETGQAAESGDGKHAHAVFELEGGGRVIYSDPRRFGYMLLIPEAELADHPAMRSLGVEPLSQDLSAAYLASRAAGRKTDLKAFLMDQRNVAGLGNIYVLEALHLAGLKPSRGAASLATRTGKPTPHAERLADAIRTVLTAAVAAGGSTLRDYRQADGSTGSFQKTFRVYGREGEPCLTPSCRGTVRRSIQGGRSSFFCPVCQH
jgi:formamidopyrimidine-DNA glycosylase